MIERLGLRRPRGATRGRTVRRLEAAARARRLHAAEPAAAAARRADRGRRSQGAARVLERDSRARRPKGSPCWSRPTTWTRPSAATRSLTSPTAILLVHGTVEQVIAASHLTTYAVSAPTATASPSSPMSWRARPGIDMVAPFGTSLHVSGRDQAALDAAIAPYRERSGLDWTRSQPSLEDVFIDLMGVAGQFPMNAEKRTRGGFWRRTAAMLIKEFIQLRRDRVSFAMIVMIPLMQLMLFGYAINTTPRHLPTAVLLQEQSDLGRSILQALENTKYFEVTRIRPRRSRVRPRCWPPARCCSRSKSRPISSARCAAATARRCWSRRTRPIRWPPARRSARSGRSCTTALAHDRAIPDTPVTPRSRSAPMPATIRPERPRSTSCPAWSAPSSP